MKDYQKNEESLYTQYQDGNNLYDWAMSQKLPVKNFEWIKDASQIRKDFIKIYNEESDKECFLEIDFNILKNYLNFMMIYHCYLKE